MDRPVRFLSLLLAALAGGGALCAQELAPAPAEIAAPPRRARAISPRVSQMISASLPKYAPTTSDAKTAPSGAPRLAVDRPANGIVRLPDYIVREPKLPTAEQVMTRKAIAEFAMKKYLGPSDGFDRGFLNAFTIADLRKKMGVFGYLLAFIPSVTNEERAMMYYEEDERLRKMKDLTELASFPSRNGTSADNEKLKREIQKAFMRD